MTADTGPTVALRLCSRYLRSGALAVVASTDGATVTGRPDGRCPVHHTAVCVTTYYAAGHVARWTWAGWWRWRRARKAGRR